MLKKKLIPSTLIDPLEVQPVEIVPVKGIGRFQTIPLVFNLFTFVLSMIWIAARKRGQAEMATKTRNFLEHLGGLWIKAGQLISLRSDILSPEMTDELSKLQFLAYGFAPEIARQVVGESLGEEITAVFDIFEEHPFAAASISQVHKARLRHNGVWVAVKVQRPDITKIFERDLKIITFILRQMNKVPAVSFITWDGMIRELNQIMREEIDYRYEVSNLRRLRKLLRKHNIYVPKVYKKYSGKQIIVMEFVTGVLMTDYLRLERNDPERVETWRRENNMKPYRVGSRLLRSFYRQLFEDNLFHGDLHPGNIVLLRNSRFALIDLGTIGSMESRFIDQYKMQAKSFSEKDYSKAVDYYLLMCDSIPLVDITPFRTESVEVYRTWEARTHLQGMSFYDKSITGGVAVEASEIARKYKVNPTWQLLRVARTLGTLDANLNALLGDANPNKIMKKYFRQARQRQIRRLRKKGIGSIIGGILTEAKVSANFATDKLRQGAIRFQGIQKKIDHFFEIVFRVIRLAIFIGLVIVVYDFLHLHYFDLIGWIHNRIGAFGVVGEQIPPYPFEIGIAAILIVLYLYFIVGKIKNHFRKETVRLPNGRLDT